MVGCKHLLVFSASPALVAAAEEDPQAHRQGQQHHTKDNRDSYLPVFTVRVRRGHRGTFRGVCTALYFIEEVVGEKGLAGEWKEHTQLSRFCCNILLKLPDGVIKRQAKLLAGGSGLGAVSLCKPSAAVRTAD